MSTGDLLHEFARYGDLDDLKVLLKENESKDIDIDAKDGGGSTPLHKVCVCD